VKGVVLAGGLGSRLFPLTKVINKHLLPVGQKPMIYYPIEKFVEAGVEQILVVTGAVHIGDIVSQLGSGRDFGCDLTYKAQDGAGGIAEALGFAQEFASGSPICAVLGDNIFQDSLRPFVDSFLNQGVGAKVILKEVPDPNQFGVPVFENDRVVAIEEKPEVPQSPFAVTGVYFYDSQVFDIINALEPSARGELEITDVNNAYIEKGELTVDYLQGWWADAGEFPGLAEANNRVTGLGE
jgi:glucose-1-phosphate thymidylyltransferase